MKTKELFRHQVWLWSQKTNFATLKLSRPSEKKEKVPSQKEIWKMSVISVNQGGQTWAQSRLDQIDTRLG